MKYLHELVMEDIPKEVQVILPELDTLDFIRQGRNLVLYEMCIRDSYRIRKNQNHVLPGNPINSIWVPGEAVHE